MTPLPKEGGVPAIRSQLTVPIRTSSLLNLVSVTISILILSWASVVQFHFAGLAAPGVQAEMYMASFVHVPTDADNAVSTRPDPSLPTIALVDPFLKGGFRNQAMRFTAFVFEAKQRKVPQILLPSMRWGDNGGTNKAVPFEVLFDVEHWNSFYPKLPRFVTYDYAQHYQWDNSSRLFGVKSADPLKPGSPTQFLIEDEASRRMPYGGGGGTRAGKLWNMYRSYASQQGRDPTEALIHRALQPAKIFRGVMDELMSTQADSVQRGDYLALHARIEPDMQNHRAGCSKLKTFDLKHILQMVDEKFRDDVPPAVFMLLNRKELESGAKPEANNTLAAANLEALDQAENLGLWGGKAKVFSFGVQALWDAKFDNMRVVGGSLVDYFLAIRAKTFVGTPISTFSVDVWTARYYRGRLSNFKYLPGRLEVATVNGTDPEHYSCYMKGFDFAKHQQEQSRKKLAAEQQRERRNRMALMQQHAMAKRQPQRGKKRGA